MKKNTKVTIVTSAMLLLSACTTTSMLDNLPDRRPDYKTSQVINKIEVPPDLSNYQLNDTMDVAGLKNNNVVASYSDFTNSKVRRNDSGFIEVLPDLYKVKVDQTSGQLPSIIVDANAETVWQAVKKYWQYNGIRLAIEQPSIGVMETDWLERQSNTPQTGVSGFINNMLGFVSDDGKRDRYRVRLTKISDTQTEILLIYKESTEVAMKDFQSGDEPAGFTWELTDNQNPEFQLEMTRRIALYISRELKSQQGLSNNTTVNNHNHSAQLGKAILTQNSGQPALLFNADYNLSWRILGIGLDRASFAIENKDINSGTYTVRYSPQSNQESPSLFAALWGAKAGEKSTNPEYLIRLSDHKDTALAVVQNLDGSPAKTDEAKALLETVKNVL